MTVQTFPHCSCGPQATAGSRRTIPRSPSPKTVTPVSYSHRRQGLGVRPGSDNGGYVTSDAPASAATARAGAVHRVLAEVRRGDAWYARAEVRRRTRQVARSVACLGHGPGATRL